MQKLFIDVDGVILCGARLPRGAKAFILQAVAEYECHWLTTHCRHGDATSVLTYLRPFVDDELFEALQKIRPTTWGMLKTDALDPASDDWIWIDDAPFATEREWLRENGRESQWIRIDHTADPEVLSQWFQ